MNADGVELGRIDSVVEADGNRYVVLEGNTVLSAGDRRVVLPMNNVMFSANGGLVLRGLTDSEMQQLGQFDPANAVSFDPETKI